jgi:hypothetical protein
MTRTDLILISAGEALVLVLVLSIALNQIGGRLTTISQGLTTLAGALTAVESQHLRPLLRNVTDINQRFTVIVPTMKGIAAKAALVVKIVTGG